MEYSIEDLIGMMNLAIIAANAEKKEVVVLPKLAVSEIRTYLEDFKTSIEG